MNVIPSIKTLGGYRPTLTVYLAARHLYAIYVLIHSLLSITLGDRYFVFFLFSDDHTNMQSKRYPAQCITTIK